MDLCRLIEPRKVYGKYSDPIFEGSGGGGIPLQTDNFSTPYGSGGGVIYIEVINQLQCDGFISSNGLSSKNLELFGGGSGGSI